MLFLLRCDGNAKVLYAYGEKVTKEACATKKKRKVKVSLNGNRQRVSQETVAKERGHGTQN